MYICISIVTDMKKIILALAVLFTVGVAQAQKPSGGYFQLGTSVDHHSWTQEAQIGTFVGKHQVGAIVETSGDSKYDSKDRPFSAGIAYQFAQPVGKTIKFLANAEAKVGLRGNSDIVLEPGIGLGFNITPGIQLQTGISTRFDKQLHHSGQQGQFDAGLNFKF